MKYILCIGLFFALHVTGAAQSKTLQFKHLSVQDGLSRSWVKCFLQDRTGLLWIGTGDGLNKFDGKTFTVYKYLPELSKSLNHNNINVIFEDSGGKLWIGTQAGINYYERDSNAFVPVPGINNYVTSVYELEKNKLLLGTAGGLFLFNTATHYTKQLTGSIYIEKILKDNKGTIWLATHSGLMRFHSAGNIVSPVNFESGFPQDEYIISMFQDSRGSLWVGTLSDGLFHFTYPDNAIAKATFTHFKPHPTDPYGITPGALYAIAEDQDHTLWIGIENGGLNLLNLDDFDRGNIVFTRILSNPSDFSSLSNNSVHTLYTDKQHSMWIGTYAGGVNHYNKLLQRFGHHESIPGSDQTINDKYVSSILDEEKYLLVGTEKGLNRRNKATGRWEYFMHDFKNPNSLGSNAVLSMMRDRRNRLWVGTYGGGLNLFDEKTKSFQHFRHRERDPRSISNDNIYKIAESSDHKIWIGTMGGGIAVYNPSDGSFTHYGDYPDQNTISSNWIFDLVEDHLGNMWISTTEAVDMFNPFTGHFTTFTHDTARRSGINHSINYNGATCLFRDSHNTIWIGTSNGLNYFVPADSSFRHYTVDDGLPNNFIKAITEDGNGNIWFSTNNTLTMFKNGTGLPINPQFKSFFVFDDIPSSEFVGRAVCRNNRGELYFGSTNGYFVFDPSTIRNNPAVPEIIFTDLRVNNVPARINTPGSPLQKDVSVTTQLKLSRNQNVFTIGFAALNFIEPENNLYAFKLEGFDQQWNYVGHQRTATYTNLDPGEYTFRVRASNNDGLWNKNGISMKIIILPAWWQTWYAKIVYAALFVLAVFFFRKHTIISVNLKNVLWREHLEKQKTEELTQLKQQFFANVSHEIRTPLTLILGPLNKLVKEKKKIPELDTIFRNSTRLKVLVDQFLDFSKNENHMMTLSPVKTEIRELTQHILTNFADYAGQRNVALKLETAFSTCVTMIDQDKYEKILNNLLSNAVKSISTEGAVTVELSCDIRDSNLVIRITDTGRGIAPEESKHIFERYYSGPNHLKNIHGTGIGLYLTRELIGLQKGTIDVFSTVGKGSTFTVILPIAVLEFESGHHEINFVNSTAAVLEDNGCEMPEQFARTILVIDDNPDMCDYVESILHDEFNVVKENNPMEGINKVIKYMPDLVISDVMMPEMDGFQLCRLIKEDIRFSHIPVVLLTAKATKNDHIAGYETGADDYVYKPFDEEILKARVRSLILRLDKLRRHFVGHDGIIDRNVETNALDVKFMEDVLAEIKANFSDPEFNVHQIVEKMGMSRSLFYKKFKSLSDQSINDLIKNFRLKKATKLLGEGRLTVSQIAYECGFTDPAYFSRVFKEAYNVAPKDFATHSKIV